MFKLFTFSPMTSILLVTALAFGLFGDTPTWFRIGLFSYLVIERALLHVGLFYFSYLFKHPEKLMSALLKTQKK